MTGCLHGPMNEENLNGTLPAMLSGAVGLNFNSDLQIPYRFPVTETTRDRCVCEERCWETDRPIDMVLAAQRAQNAAAGYAADYQCKRCAPSFNEVREIKKGHHALAEQTKDRTAAYRANRHMKRFLSDMYGRGVVRSAQESANLRAYRDPRDVTGAESIKTAKTAMIPGAEAVRMAERLCADGDGVTVAASGILEADKREGT